MIYCNRRSLILIILQWCLYLSLAIGLGYEEHRMGKMFYFSSTSTKRPVLCRVWCCTVYCDSSRVPPVSPSHLIVGIHTANQYNWLLTIHWAPLACLHLIKKYSKISFVCILGNFYPQKVYLLNSMVAAWNRSVSVDKDLVMWPQMRHSLK